MPQEEISWQEEISCHGVRFLITGRKKFLVTQEELLATGKNFLSEAEMSSYRKKFLGFRRNFFAQEQEETSFIYQTKWGSETDRFVFMLICSSPDSTSVTLS